MTEHQISLLVWAAAIFLAGPVLMPLAIMVTVGIVLGVTAFMDWLRPFGRWRWQRAKR